MSTGLARAATAIRCARAVLISAGAGMGVDSGLPDFRGDEGFWRAYPAAAALGLRFEDLAQPRWFTRDPTLAWGFYGHRLQLYRSTVPHPGFARALAWVRRAPAGGAVFTSNVDGQFQRAGFAESEVTECHGSLAWLQCTEPCSDRVWRADDLDLDVDVASLRARAPLPRCLQCGALARPNVLMFGDARWVSDRTGAQEARLDAWLRNVGTAATAIVEFGAGTAVPTVRALGERLAARGATLVRINPREADVPRGQIGIALGADDASARIAALLGE